MYSTGQAVVYASYGVCVISAIEKHDFSGEDIEYYVLRPINDHKNTFYVPTSNSTLVNKMRPVFSHEEAEKLIKVMPDENSIWIDDEAARKEAYSSIIDSGDRLELVKLIKTLYIHKQKLAEQHKQLHSNDERFLNNAENMLFDELAYALGIPREEVIPYIEAHI